MNIRPATEHDAARWDAYVLAHPQGTFFHRYGWKRLIESTYAYPGHYLLAESDDRVQVFHAGTALQDGDTVTAGGRVLGVTALGSDIPSAIETAYTAVEKIRFDGAQYRQDIGAKGLARLG